MATIAEQLIGTATQNAGNVTDIGASIHQGAQLAQTVQNMQAQRQQLDMKREELDDSKWSKFGELTKIGHDMPESKARDIFLNKTLPAAGQSLLPNQIHPQVMEQLTKEPSVGSYLQDEVKTGRMSKTEMKQTLADPELYAKVFASDDYKSHMAAKDLEPLTVKPDPDEISPELTRQAKGLLSTPIMQGSITMADIYRAKQDPEKMKTLLAQTGLDKIGGEQALDNVINTYPKALADAEKAGISHKDAMIMAGMRAGPQADRTKAQIVMHTQDQVNKDTTLTNFDQRAVGARRLNVLINNALNEKDPAKRIAKTKQLMGAVAAEESALVTGKNNFSEGSTERAAYDNAAAQAGTLRDNINSLFTKDGTVTDVQALTAQLKNAKVQANEMGKSYISEINGRLDTITSEEGSLPAQMDVYRGKRKAYADKFKGAFEDSPGEKTVNVMGHSVSVDKAKAFYKAHPDIQPDAQMKKDLGL